MKNFLKIVKNICIPILILSFGCSQQSPSDSARSLSKSSIVLMKVSTANSNNEISSELPIPGGSLNITSAFIHVNEIGIEENFGFDGEQEGEHDDGDENHEGENDEEVGDIEINGPFILDVSSGEAFIDTVHVYPGIFTKVEIEFIISEGDPFLGNSIVISGEFSPDGGIPIPFNLFSTFSEEIEVSLAQGSIDVQAEETISVTIVFDFSQWFAGMDFTSADITDGHIIIDSQINSNMLTIFENNLGENTEIEEDDD